MNFYIIYSSATIHLLVTFYYYYLIVILRDCLISFAPGTSLKSNQEATGFVMALWDEARTRNMKGQRVEAVFLLEFGIATCNIIDNPVLELAMDKELEFMKAKLRS